MNKNINCFLMFLYRVIFFWRDWRCQYCKKSIFNENESNNIFCLQCISKIGYQSISLHNKKYPIYSLGRYDGILRYIVTEKYKSRSFSYNGISHNIIYVFKLHKINFDIIIYIPKKIMNYMKQKYNSSYVIAEIINKHYNKKIFHSLFYSYLSHSQSGKSMQERQGISTDLFFIPQSDQKILKNKTILLVDDVYTTGSTINSVIQVLKKCKVKNILIFVIAKK